VVGRPPSPERPYIRDDNEQPLSEHIRKISEDIAAGGRIPEAVKEFTKDLLNVEPHGAA
jgi:phenylalanine ammonia-lyase